MFDMRALPSEVARLRGLTEQERLALRYVGEGLSPREISDRVEVSEQELYRLVAWALDELEPAPDGQTMADVHARHGSRAASPEDIAEFERRFGSSLPADDEG